MDIHDENKNEVRKFTGQKNAINEQVDDWTQQVIIWMTNHEINRKQKASKILSLLNSLEIINLFFFY